MTDYKTNTDFQTWSSLFEYLKLAYSSDDVNIKYLDEENEEVGIESQQDLDYAYQISLNSTDKLLRLYIRNSRNELLGRQQIKVEFFHTNQTRPKAQCELRDIKTCDQGFTESQIRWLENYLENFKKNIHEEIESKINSMLVNKLDLMVEGTDLHDRIKNLYCKINEARSKNQNLKASLYEEELQSTNAFMAEFVKDYNLPDGSTCEPNEKLQKIWVIKNTGKLDWSFEDYPVKLVNVNGNIKVETDSVLVNNTKVNQTAVISVELMAPSEPGNYFSEWVLSCKNFQFGPKIWCSIRVNDNSLVVFHDDDNDDEFEILPSCFDLTKRWTIESIEEKNSNSSSIMSDSSRDEKISNQDNQANESKILEDINQKKSQIVNNFSNAFDVMKKAVSNLGSPSFGGAFDVMGDDFRKESRLNELMIKLISMGFANRDQNRRLILEHDFNLEKVIQYLVEEMDNNWADNR